MVDARRAVPITAATTPIWESLVVCAGDIGALSNTLALSNAII